jgi:hypothetical protein
MPLSADDIRNAFEALSEELDSDTPAEITIAGGAALVLLFSARPATKDVDAYFVRPEASVLRSAAEAVAERLQLPGDWLNDAAKGYFVGLSSGNILYESRSLIVRAASNEQLLAMKPSAWRDAVDRADAALLLSQLRGSADDIWSSIQPFVPPALRDKASYAFEDLWEVTRGH